MVLQGLPKLLLFALTKQLWCPWHLEKEKDWEQLFIECFDWPGASYIAWTCGVTSEAHGVSGFNSRPSRARSSPWHRVLSILPQSADRTFMTCPSGQVTSSLSLWQMICSNEAAAELDDRLISSEWLNDDLTWSSCSWENDSENREEKHFDWRQLAKEGADQNLTIFGERMAFLSQILSVHADRKNNRIFLSKEVFKLYCTPSSQQ